MTSRWLAEVAAERGLTVRWHPFSLALLNEGTPLPPEFDTPENRANIEVAGRAIRVLAVLAAAHDYERAGRFYAEFGRRFHDGEHAGDDVVEDAATAAGVVDAFERLGASYVDDVLAASVKEAVAVAGPDVGSPVLRIGDAERGFHGPIQSPRLTGRRALRLFDAIATLQAEDAFYEIKRGRPSGPAVGQDVHY
jgi:hypothetical protein